MATGIPSKKQNNNKIPITLMYEGKKDKDSIIHNDGVEFKKVASVNGDSDNSLFYGDNLYVLLYLLNNGYRGKIKLIYIDPPFATVSNFVNKNQELAYCDPLNGGAYVEFLRERIIIMNELLSDDGSIYIHLDNNMAFTIKLVMDEIFGEKNFRAFITRKKCSTKNYTKNTFGNISDYILFYSKSTKYTWNRPYDPWEHSRMIEEYPYIDQSTGKRYKKVPIHAPGTRNGETGKEWRGKMPPAGKHWQYTPDRLEELDENGEIYWSANGNPRRKVFCDPSKGVPIQDIWLNYRDSINQSQKTTGYPTEKNLEMLKMIVESSSNPGDIVLDCFAGSGTTLDAAFCCNRKWIGADNSLESIKSIIKRFTKGLEIYGDYVDKKENNIQLSLDLEQKCSFSIFSAKDQKKEIEKIYEILQNN